jgi:HAD superfamily 5'-nucleotidase-like hydrolase
VALDRTQPASSPEPPAADLLRDPELQRLLAAPGQAGLELPASRQIYTNRSLRLDQISLVGFDMDYTLAVYSMRLVEELAFRMTLERLVSRRGHPESLLAIRYDHEFVIRGLVIDKDQGHLFKMDRHNHVGRCYHGRRLVPTEERRALYQNEKIRLSLPRFAWIDTLFSLPEACLYAEVIEALEQRPAGAHPKVDYHKLYDDVRDAIDEVHRDGSLKTELKKDLATYILRDPELGPALHKLRSGGKKLFLLTNSLWDYTDAVMRYLLDGQLAEYPSWRNYFDLVVTGAQKPAFFAEQRPFLELDPAGAVRGKATSLERGVVYEGGNLFDFERLSGHGGEGVLYVGDHIYGDIIRNRKTSLWRTCFIVQELEQEIDYLERNAPELSRLRELDRVRARLDDLINQHKLQLNAVERAREREAERARERETTSDLDQRRLRGKADLEALRRVHRAVLSEASALEERLDRGRNRYWGFCFKEGNENSRFGEQVENYADLYTSRVSNLLYYSPMQFFRSPRGAMPHERSLGQKG